MDEHEPFLAFLRTLKVPELVMLRHEAIVVNDVMTKKACDEEFQRRGPRIVFKKRRGTAVNEHRGQN